MTVLIAGGVGDHLPPGREARRAHRGRPGAAARVPLHVRRRAARQAHAVLLVHVSRPSRRQGNYVLELRPEVAHDQEAPAVVEDRDRAARRTCRSRSPTPRHDGDSTEYSFSNIKLNPVQPRRPVQPHHSARRAGGRDQDGEQRVVGGAVGASDDILVPGLSRGLGIPAPRTAPWRARAKCHAWHRGGQTRQGAMIGTFTVVARDGSTGARASELVTAHGVVRSPAFMPVGTAGSVKGLAPWELERLAPEIVLANTYHLLLRPGVEADRAARRAAPLHGLGGPDPHRLGRVPGLLARRPAPLRRGRRHVPLAHRRERAAPHPGGLRRRAAAARRRRGDGARRLPGAARPAAPSSSTRWR